MPISFPTVPYLRCYGKFYAALSVAAALVSATGAWAQGTTVYDTSTGKIIARSMADSQGAITIYDAAGRVTGRTATTGNTTTVYDGPSGRVVGRIERRKNR
jgi:YD repeat-containing protein